MLSSASGMRWIGRSGWRIALAALCLLWAGGWAHAVVYVNDDAAGTASGTSWTDAYTTIQDGVDRAVALGGGEVWVAAGTYTGTGSTAVVELASGVYVYGGFAGTESSRDARNYTANVCAISGQNDRRCVVGAATSTLDGFTITLGFDASAGAGLYNATGQSPTIANCIFLENDCNGQGGAIYNDGASPSITNCTFDTNTAVQAGGAIYNTNNSAPTVRECTFDSNATSSTTGRGGAIYNSASAMTVTRCLFTGNSVPAEGGAIYNTASASSSPKITNCMIVDNSAREGAGFYENAAGSSLVPIITNCTIYSNSATSRGGAISVYAGTPQVTNCILWGNSGGQLYTASGASITVTYSTIQGGYSGSGNLSTNPAIVSESTPNYHLSSTSPCIDAGRDTSGTAFGSVSVDYDGDGRPIDGSTETRGDGSDYDIGADEYTGGSSGSCSLTMAVNTTAGGSVEPAIGTHTMTCGSSATLTATPLQGYVFDHWEGAVTGSTNPTTISVDSVMTVTAVFAAEVVNYTLTLAVSGPGSLSPAPGTYTYAAGTVVTLTATADDGAMFSRWEGDWTGRTTPVSIPMTRDKTITAVFAEGGTGEGYGYKETVGSGDDAITLLRVGGTRREMGYWYGKLLADQIAAVWTSFHAYVLAEGITDDMLAFATYALFTADTTITAPYAEEFAGIAAGCAAAGHSEITVDILYRMHAIPDLGEMGCSLFAAWGNATKEGHLIQLRNLDWIMDAGVQDYPVVTIFDPDDGNLHIVTSFAGMIGAIGGMNEYGLAVSEIMGSFTDPETLAGAPMPLLLREVLYNDTTLDEGLKRMKDTKRTCNYYYCLGDAFADDPKARLLLTSNTRFDVYKDNESVSPHPNPAFTPFHTAMDDAVYWRRHDGRGNEIIYNAIQASYGSVDENVAIEIAKAAGVDDTVMSVVYDATALELWVAYAQGTSQPAHTRAYVNIPLEAPTTLGGSGFRTTVGTDEDEIPVVVVSGTPEEMGYHYGRLMKREAREFINGLASRFADLGLGANAADILDAAWTKASPYFDSRLIEELTGFAAGTRIDIETLRRVHMLPLVAPYSCSSIAAWDNATATGHMLQTRDLDWDLEIGAHNYPCIVLYKPTSGIPHLNVTFAGFLGSHTGMNAAGITLAEMGDSSSDEFPYDLAGTHFSSLFRTILYDAPTLTNAVSILSNATRIKKYHYVFADGKSELAAVKIKAHTGSRLQVWTDDDAFDEFAPYVLEDVVYNDEGRGIYPYVKANYGAITPELMIQFANRIPISGSNVMNVVYDSTTLELWAAFAEGSDEAYKRTYVHFDMKAYFDLLDSDGDGINDDVEGSTDADGDGVPNYLDLDSDGDDLLDSFEGMIDADLDGTMDYLDTDSDDDGILDANEGSGDQDNDGTPNFRDTDSDSDGLLDGVEGASDLDGDGLANFVDTDSDGDGLTDRTEGMTDTDGDGAPNCQDTDSDSDGIGDAQEASAGTDPYDVDDPGVAMRIELGTATEVLNTAYYASGSGTAHTRHALFGAFSGNDSKIAFWSVDGTTLKRAVFLVDPGDPTSWRRLTADAAALSNEALYCEPLQWTPDSSAVVHGIQRIGVRGLQRVDILTGAATKLNLAGYSVEHGAFTSLPSGNWVMAVVPDTTSAGLGDELVAIPIFCNGGDDFTREAVPLTAWGTRGYDIDWPAVASDLNAISFSRQASSWAYSYASGDVYTLRNLQALLAGTTTAAASLSDARIRATRVVTNFSYASSFSPDTRFVAYTEDWNRYFAGASAVLSTMARSDFDIMVSAASANNSTYRVAKIGNQFAAAPSRDGARVLYGQDIDGVMHLFVAPVIVYSKIEGVATGAAAQNDIMVNTETHAADGSGTILTLSAGTVVDFPVGARHELSITAPVDPPTPSELPAGADALVLVREFGPTGTAFTPGVLVTITYTDAQIAGMQEETLAVYVYNSATARYDTEVTPILARDLDANTISFRLDHFSSVALGGLLDTDNDGDPNRTDPDDDNDGIADNADPMPLDSDNDGMANANDPDADNDGIMNGDDAFPFDTDNDGLDNGVDPDDDADGILDTSDSLSLDTDNDGIPNATDTDDDGDRLPDALEGLRDTDGDHIPDHLDLDSDGDGLPDIMEGSADTDSDGLYDAIDTDSDNDTLPDSVENSTDMDSDRDDDRIPNFRDSDSDNDGIPDRIEGATDPDTDGTPNFLDLDSDGDGLLDAREGTADTDGDTTPNFLDTDSDNDTILDNQRLDQWNASEGLNDIDGNGIPNYLDLDSDGDLLSDEDEVNTYHTNPYARDTDGDGVSDNAEVTNATNPLSNASYTALAVSPAVQNVTSEAGVATFMVANSTGVGAMAWKATVASGDWIEISAGSAGVNGGAITVVYDANDTPVERTASMQVVAQDSLGSPAIVKLVQAGCATPDAPLSVTASDGTYADRVHVTWTTVEDATEYRVYRYVENSTTSARPISDWITDAAFDDRTALPPKSSSVGCSGRKNTDYTKYYYWVKARNTCAESPYSTSDIGWTGDANSSDKEKNTTFEPVFPSLQAEESVYGAQPGSKLFIRLRSTEVIDAETVWGSITTKNGELTGLEWFPVVEGDMRDIWVYYAPAEPFEAGENILITAGAFTIAGDAVEPVTAVFVVEQTLGDAGEGLVEPGVATNDAYPAAEVTALATDEVPALANAVSDLAYRISPDEAFPTPKRVWLPVPDGVEASSVDVFYCHEGGEEAGWYSAEDVEGWLATDKFVTESVDGVSYLGILVNHAGVVALAARIEPAAVEPATLGSSSMDIVLLIGIPAVCTVLGARRARRARASR